MSNLSQQYAAYFDSFKTAIQDFVNIVKAFVETIQKFVNGFKKNITVEEPFEDSDI
jgi:hypothetical protein